MENIIKIDNLNIGSLHIQGLNNRYKQKCAIEDLKRYHLNILAVQETKFKTTCLETITTKEGRTFNLYYFSEQNKYHGTVLSVTRIHPSVKQDMYGNNEIEQQ